MIKGGKRGYEQLVSIPEPEEKAASPGGGELGQGCKGCHSLQGFETESFPIYRIPLFLVSPLSQPSHYKLPINVTGELPVPF